MNEEDVVRAVAGLDEALKPQADALYWAEKKADTLGEAYRIARREQQRARDAYDKKRKTIRLENPTIVALTKLNKRILREISLRTHGKYDKIVSAPLMREEKIDEEIGMMGYDLHTAQLPCILLFAELARGRSEVLDAYLGDDYHAPYRDSVPLNVEWSSSWKYGGAIDRCISTLFQRPEVLDGDPSDNLNKVIVQYAKLTQPLEVVLHSDIFDTTVVKMSIGTDITFL